MLCYLANAVKSHFPYSTSKTGSQKKLNETLKVAAKEQQFKQVYSVKKLSTIAFCMDNFSLEMLLPMVLLLIVEI